MLRTTPEQVETFHYLINQATNLTSAIADALADYGDLDEVEPHPEMAIRVRTTKALQVRDALVAILDLLTDEPY